MRTWIVPGSFKSWRGIRRAIVARSREGEEGGPRLEVEVGLALASFRNDV